MKEKLEELCIVCGAPRSAHTEQMEKECCEAAWKIRSSKRGAAISSRKMGAFHYLREVEKL